MMNTTTTDDFLDRRFDQMVKTYFGQYFGLNSSVWYLIHDYWEKGADPRTKGFFLVDLSAIGFFLLVIGSYLTIVFALIPEITRKREAFTLRKTMIVYNIILVFINGYFFFKVLFEITNFGRKLWDFSNPKTDTSPAALEFIRVAHLYYLSKILDFFDTFFMALKKKNSQITFLHIWHHISMVGAGWMYMKYNPYMPTSAIVPIVNGFIHVLMYSYYALSALGPKWHRFLWWKQYMTRMQLIQFILVFSYFVIVAFKQTDLPLGYLSAMLGNATFLFLLFLNFYLKEYSKKKKEALKGKKAE